MSNELPKAPRWSVAPYFHVGNVVAAAEFYRDKLGFEFDRFWGEPACFCMPQRSGVVVMLSQVQPPHKPRPNRTDEVEGGAWDAYVWIDDADALAAEFKSKGVALVREVCDQEYGCRDFEIDDLDGYRLCFGQNLET